MDGEASKAETDQPSKKRKVAEKTVIRVRIENGGLGTQLAPPSDSWSWRKYGQKPIKGSPFPRGYYRCSTSKECTAKKQVEKCKADESVLVITYSSFHNHPHSSTTSTAKTKKRKKKKKKSTTTDDDDEILFHYDLEQAAAGDDQLFSITEADQTRGNSMGFDDVLEEEDVLLSRRRRRQLGEFTNTDQEAELMEMENDFFYELEDLSVPHYLY